MSIRPTARLLSALIRASLSSDRDAEFAIYAGNGAPSGGTLPGGQTLASGQQALYFRADASSVDAALYLTVDGGTTWVPLVTSGAGGTQADLIFDAATELTIAAGVVTATQGYHRIDTQGDAASDDLDTVSGIAEGEVVVVRAENAARTVVLKHNTGNLWCGGGVDISLAEANDVALLVGMPSSKVAVVAFQTLGALPANLSADLASTANGKGASLVGIEDSGARYTGTTVEAGLAEAATTAALAATTTGKGASLVGIEDASARFTGAQVEAALGEVPTSAELVSVTNGKGASLVGIEDASADYTGVTVEAVLAEVAAERLRREIADPGTGNAIPVTKSGVCNLTSAGPGETRTLAIPTFSGQRLALMHSVDGGDIAITSAQRINQAGNTIMTLTQAEDFIELVGCKVGGALRWQVTANDGVALS